MTPVTIGDAVLYLGDCREVLPTLAAGSVDAVVTDPPYDEEAHTPMRRTRAAIEGRSGNEAMFFDALTEEERKELTEQGKRLSCGWVIIFCQAEAVGTYRRLFAGAYRRAMVWVKPDSAPQFSGDRPAMGYESIVAAWVGPEKSRWNGGGRRGVFIYNSTGYVHEHPAQKPIGLMVELISLFSEMGALVLDPYMGSGTTGVACLQTGRKFIGIERDGRSFDIACRRIEAAAMQMRLPLDKG
jgi:site-specific DNA-methyltransferase (adenine-specific)